MARIFSFERKLVGAFILAAIFPLLMQYLVSFSVIDMQFDNVRDERYELVRNNIQREIESQKKRSLLINIDYAHWSDLYINTIEKNYSWFEDMFSNITSEDGGVDIVYVLNKNNEIIHEYNPQEGFLESNEGYISIAKAGNDISSLVSINDNLYIVSFACIEDTDNMLARGGTLIMGQAFSKELIRGFPQAHDFNVDIVHSGFGIKNKKGLSEYENLLRANNKQLERLDNVRYYKLFDFNGRVIALLEIEETGNFIEEAISKTKSGFYIILGMTIIVLVAFVGVLKNNIMLPIRELRKKISKMRDGSYSSEEQDEIIALSEEFEAMSKEINSHTAEMEEQNKTLQYLVYRDDITGAYNKRFFRQKIEEEFKIAVEQGSTLCLCLMDIDYFKVYKELISSSERYEVLGQIYRILDKKLGQKSHICFDGTDEFRIIMPNTISKDAIDSIREISASISNERFTGMERLPKGCITVSSGLATYPNDAENVDKLYSAAVDRLYRAKNHSQGDVGYYYSIFNNIKDEVEADRRTLIYSTKAFLAVIDAMDEYTYTHTEGVVRYASIIAEQLQLDENQKENIKIGALLHDIGKLELGRELLNKREQLTDEEVKLIKHHPLFGVNMLKTLRYFEEISDIVKYHHERFDGKGYPEGLADTNIPLGARIVAIADSFDAMTTTRAYRRNHKSFEEAAEELMKCAGAQFDPHIVEVFVNYIKKNNYTINIL